MTETIAPAAPLATFLKGAGVPREHQAAASTAVLMWLEQLGPNTAAATLLHTAEALKQVQDHNAELVAERDRGYWGAYNEGEAHGIESQTRIIEDLTESRERAIRCAVHLENQLAAVEARIKHWDSLLDDTEGMLPRWVAMDLRMAMGMTFDEAAAAALAGGEQ